MEYKFYSSPKTNLTFSHTTILYVNMSYSCCDIGKKINVNVSYARNKIIASVSEIYVQMTPIDWIMNAKRV